VLALDLAGLATGVLVNLLLIRFFLQERSRPFSQTRLLPMSALTLQTAQLALLWLAPQAYLRHRDDCQLLQRSVRLLQNAAAYLWMPRDAVAPWLNSGGHSSSWQRLLMGVLINPMSTFLNAINHGLQFRHQVGCRASLHCWQHQRGWPLLRSAQRRPPLTASSR
jgi:hypothetical protein